MAFNTPFKMWKRTPLAVELTERLRQVQEFQGEGLQGFRGLSGRWEG